MIKSALLFIALCLPMIQSEARTGVELPVGMSYWITSEVEIILSDTACSTDPTQGYMAEAHSVPDNRTVYGCYVTSGDMVKIWLELGPNTYADLLLYKSKFKPIYAM